MKVFLDFEFTGLHQNTTPISLALRAQDGHELYIEFTDYDRSQIDRWLQDNVLDNLILPDRQAENAGEIGTSFLKASRSTAMYALSAWLDLFDDVTIIGDCLAYDWVLFCELFRDDGLPGHVNYIPVELCTVLAMHGIDPDTSRELLAEKVHPVRGLKHNALHDVRVMAAIWDGLEREAAVQYLPYFYRDVSKP
jgi:hypothetical protein